MALRTASVWRATSSAISSGAISIMRSRSSSVGAASSSARRALSSQYSSRSAAPASLPVSVAGSVLA
jgi:hypothetical protein